MLYLILSSLPILYFNCSVLNGYFIPVSSIVISPSPPPCLSPFLHSSSFFKCCFVTGLVSSFFPLDFCRQEFIGETSLDQLLGIQAKDIQCLLTQVEQQLNENLTLSYRDEQPTFYLDISMAGKPETLVKQIVIPEEITKPKKTKTYVQAKRKELGMYGVIYGMYLGPTSGHQKKGSIRPGYLK